MYFSHATVASITPLNNCAAIQIQRALCFIYSANFKHYKMLKTRLLCSESGHSTQNFYVCEASTGSIVRFYNGSNIIAERTAAVIAGDYVVAAERSKPIVHFWSMDSQMPFLKSTVPGIISNLVVSRCGLFLIASIANKLYIWQTNSGNLLTVIDQHVQTITALTVSCSIFSLKRLLKTRKFLKNL